MPTPDDPKHADPLFNYAMGEFNRRLDGIEGSLHTIQRDHTAALQGIQRSIEEIRLGMVRADGTREVMATQISALQASDKAVLDAQAAAVTAMTAQHGKLAEQTGKIDERVKHIEAVQASDRSDKPGGGLRAVFGAIGSLIAAVLATVYFVFGKEPPAAILSLINARPETP